MTVRLDVGPLAPSAVAELATAAGRAGLAAEGGLTTTMELTAAGRPFLYFPLLHHFEQQRHVAHRLDRHRAGVRMDYATATPESIGEALADALARPVEYRPVPADGAPAPPP